VRGWSRRSYLFSSLFSPLLRSPPPPLPMLSPCSSPVLLPSARYVDEYEIKHIDDNDSDDGKDGGETGEGRETGEGGEGGGAHTSHKRDLGSGSGLSGLGCPRSSGSLREGRSGTTSSALGSVMIGMGGGSSRAGGAGAERSWAWSAMEAVRYVIKYFSLYSVYIQCEGFAKLTFYLCQGRCGGTARVGVEPRT
jgi:hypothetical protein